MSMLYEIVELADGEIALQKDEEGSEPLVRIKFSEESLYFLNEAKFDIAKAMIEAGLEAASDIQDSSNPQEQESREEGKVEEFTLH
ncbi:hypothetical protein [Teredinibacter purpureus]|uniref:hypothetical protein n=1 Tax=Teredinibacter purpureus TaxID=2731756 RepID=UPI0005F7B065|nr:hypothetical protein [Teredinibacter purpureus]